MIVKNKTKPAIPSLYIFEMISKITNKNIGTNIIVKKHPYFSEKFVLLIKINFI